MALSFFGIARRRLPGPKLLATLGSAHSKRIGSITHCRSTEPVGLQVSVLGLQPLPKAMRVQERRKCSSILTVRSKSLTAWGAVLVSSKGHDGCFFDRFIGAIRVWTRSSKSNPKEFRSALIRR